MRLAAIALTLMFTFPTMARAQFRVEPPQRRPVATRPPLPADYRNHATIFAGLTGEPSVLPILGGAWGGGTPNFGFELELSHTSRRAAAASWGTFLASMFVTLPGGSERMDYYGIGGIGLYGQTRPDGNGSGGLTRHLGFGVKYQVDGPVKARAEYRLFLLETTSDSRPSPPANHRFSMGLCMGC